MNKLILIFLFIAFPSAALEESTISQARAAVGKLRAGYCTMEDSHINDHLFRFYLQSPKRFSSAIRKFLGNENFSSPNVFLDDPLKIRAIFNRGKTKVSTGFDRISAFSYFKQDGVTVAWFRHDSQFSFKTLQEFESVWRTYLKKLHEGGILFDED